MFFFISIIFRQKERSFLTKGVGGDRMLRCDSFVLMFIVPSKLETCGPHRDIFHEAGDLSAFRASSKDC